jgi:hypothetical protein
MAFSALHAVKSNDPIKFKALVTNLPQETRKALIPIVESLTSDSQYLVVLYDALGDAERNQITRDKLMAQQKTFLKSYPGSSIYPDAAASLEKLQRIDVEELKKIIISSEGDVRTRGIQDLSAKIREYCEVKEGCAYMNALNALIARWYGVDDVWMELVLAKLDHRQLLRHQEYQGLRDLVEKGLFALD